MTQKDQGMFAIAVAVYAALLGGVFGVLIAAWIVL